ncbi:hypothetical protein HK101_009604 [Irineochytrium annulatum]|nr:hypothetical protein HK101_009604 [Irineochytrium annulatum]
MQNSFFHIQPTSRGMSKTIPLDTVPLGITPIAIARSLPPQNIAITLKRFLTSNPAIASAPLPVVNELHSLQRVVEWEHTAGLSDRRTVPPGAKRKGSVKRKSVDLVGGSNGGKWEGESASARKRKQRGDDDEAEVKAPNVEAVLDGEVKRPRKKKKTKEAVKAEVADVDLEVDAAEEVRPEKAKKTKKKTKERVADEEEEVNGQAMEDVEEEVVVKKEKLKVKKERPVKGEVQEVEDEVVLVVRKKKRAKKPEDAVEEEEEPAAVEDVEQKPKKKPKDSAEGGAKMKKGVKSTIVLYATLAVYVLALAMAIYSTASPWYTASNQDSHGNTIVVNVGFFSSSECFDGVCVYVTANPCDVSYSDNSQFAPTAKTMCQKWTATRAFLVLSDIVGFVGLAFFGLIIWQGADGAKWHTYGAFSSSVCVAIFMFICMCLAANLKEDAGPDAGPVAYGSAFIVAIISWIFGALAAVGVPLTYKAMQ